MRLAIGAAFQGGHLDEVHVEPTGLLQLFGWLHGRSFPEVTVAVNGEPVPQSSAFRIPRPDVSALLRNLGPLAGFGLQYSAPPNSSIRSLRIEVAGTRVANLHPDLQTFVPDYAPLLQTSEVWGRSEIYGSGPPDPAANPTILRVASSLPSPILDVGCGSGALVGALRRDAAVEAYGIDLDRPEIRAAIPSDLRPYVTLYPGALPLPFPDGRFASAVCTEVLEHVADYRSLLGEIARVCRGTVVVTVPDMSAIPACRPHFVVPWHLLEGTHVNFFTQKSLEQLLRRHFASVVVGRIGPFDVNGTRLFTSVLAICNP